MPPLKSPFPGMNPFLEDFWPDVHTRLMVSLSNAIQPQLPEGLVARIEESLTVDEEGADRYREFRADVLVAHTPSGGSVMQTDGGLAVMEPDVYEIVETVTPRHVEIIDLRGGGELITVVEVLSATNKGVGR